MLAASSSGHRRFSSFLVQAILWCADRGAANAGTDTIGDIKAGEFGIAQGGQNLAGLVIVISDIHALGLETARGAATTALWDRDDASREWSKRFQERTVACRVVQAGTCSSVLHYLRTIEATNTMTARLSLPR